MRNIFQGIFKEKKSDALILANKISKMVDGQKLEEVLNALCLILASTIVHTGNHFDKEKLKNRVFEAIQEYMDVIKKEGN